MRAVETHANLRDEDFGRTVSITEYERPGDTDDEVTGQSILLMQLYTIRDSEHPAIVQAAGAAVADAGLEPSATLREIAEAIFWWVKSHVDYVPESRLRTPFGHFDSSIQIDQQLVPPAALLAMARPAGDCPQFSMLTAAMCRVFNVPTAFKTIAADPKEPEIFSHIYCVAQPEPQIFMPLDTSNAPGPDVEYARPGKSKVWPNHQDTKEETMVRNRQQNARRITRLAGYIDSSGTFQQGDNPDPTYGGTYSAPPPDYIQASYPTPAAVDPGGGTDWTAAISAIATNASKIAAPLVATALRQAPYYITGSNGAQILYDPNTGQSALAATTKTTDLAATVSAAAKAIPSTYLLFAGLAIAVVLIAPSFAKR